MNNAANVSAAPLRSRQASWPRLCPVEWWVLGLSLGVGCRFDFGWCDGGGFAVGSALGVFCEAAAVGGLPFVVEVGEDGADEADGGRLVGDDAYGS